MTSCLSVGGTGRLRLVACDFLWMYFTRFNPSTPRRYHHFRPPSPIGAFLVAFGFLLSLPASESPVIDKPLPAAEAARRVSMPPGFQMSMSPAEPDIHQPISMAFDDCGRLWV